MILEYLKYFSRFPARDGVLDMFINGSSELYEYEELKGYIAGMSEPLVLIFPILFSDNVLRMLKDGWMP